MSVVKLEPARVQDVILWEEGMKSGETRYTRKAVTFQNVDADAAAVNAAGTITFALPTATITLTMAGALAAEAGNFASIVITVVDDTPEAVTYEVDEDGVLQILITADVTGGTNSITELVALLHAHADFVVSGTTNGAGVVDDATTGSGATTGGQDAVAVPTSFEIGQPLKFVTDHYEPVTQTDESSTVAILLANLEDVADDEEVENVPILRYGPAIVNMDAFKYCDPYTSAAAVMAALEALTPYSIDRVNEPVKQTSG